MLDRLRRALPVLIGLALFALALEVLRVQLHAVTWRALRADLVAIPGPRIAAAAGLTALNYLALTAYDFLALAYVGRRLAAARVIVASFVAYAIASNVGFAMLSGAAVRYRFYSRWGVSAEDLSRMVVSSTVTLWVGLLVLGGGALMYGPLPTSEVMPHGLWMRVLGGLLVALPVGYIASTLVRREPLRLWRFTLPMPATSLAVGQVLVSVTDWALAAGVLFVLLPAHGPSFATVLGAFLIAQLLGLASHVPGGIGVFEGLMVILLGPYLTAGELLPCLVVYRAIYYLSPLLVALVGLVIDETRQQRTRAARVGAFLGEVTEFLTPRLLAIFTFMAGLVLLFSGATPAAAGRLQLLDRFLPLGVIEASHFLGSIVGVLLLLLSQGLARRLDAAYYLTLGGAAVGAGTSLLKGGGYEEAGFLISLVFVLWRAREAFDRRASLFETRYSATWLALVVGAIFTSIWLGTFAFKHVEYSQQLWWQFELRGEASRFLRASVGASVVLLLVAIARLLRPAPHEVVPATDDDLATVRTIIEAQPVAAASLVYLRDKGLLFDDERTAFLMYAVQGRTWVALGDPVGPPAQAAPLLRRFVERCSDFAGVPVFYEVRKDGLHRYADLGLTFVKLGEEARVDLTAFTLEGPRSARYRQSMKRLEKDGGRFRVVPSAEVPALLDRLRLVSDDWLRAKSGAEKGFSLGFFDPEYLARFPVAVVECGGEVVAFANLWSAAGREELSVDLMRYHHSAPKGAMEALFVHILQWGHEQGYHWLMLGMAPLSGVESSPVAPLWNRVGELLYDHGDALYNFHGLRAYKDKFDPIWEPRYLAYPGGLGLPRILADIAALIAGGYRRIFLK